MFFKSNLFLSLQKITLYMKRLLKEIFILCVFCTSCSFPGDSSRDGVEVVNAVKAFEESTSLSLEDIAESVEYIPLQTDDRFLVGKNPNFFLINNYILAIAEKRIFLFDRNSGAFIREIGRYGQGPEEYTRTDYMCSVNEENNTVSTFANKSKRLYSLDGKTVEDIALPPLTYETAQLSSGIYAGFVPNFSGQEKNKLILFDKNATILKTFPNYFSTLPPEGIHFWKPNGWLYKYEKKLFFHELFSDTIFQVSPDSLKPVYQLYQGQYLPPYEQQNINSFISDNYFMMKSVYESTRFLFYTFSYKKEDYLLTYDKKRRKTYLNKYETDDSDILSKSDLLSFSVSGVSASGELIGFWNSYDIAQWGTTHPDKLSALSGPLVRLKNIQEMDNPVIVIAKLKK